MVVTPPGYRCHTSGALLHNLVTDSLTPSAEEAKKKPKLKVDEEDPEQ